MKIEWNTELQIYGDFSWYPYHEMSFISFKNRIYYCFLGTENKIYHIVVCDFDSVGGINQKIYRFAENEKVELPSGSNPWQYQIRENDLLLYAGKWLNISGQQITHQQDFQQEVPKKIYPNSIAYLFGDKNITFPSERTVACTELRTGRKLLKHTLRGYPYTYVEEKHGCILFGTAGRSGALYCIDIETGEIKCDAETKGTVYYCWYGEYIVMKDKLGDLQMVDPFSNRQIELLVLKNRLVDCSPMILKGSHLYAITYKNVRSDGNPIVPHITCFSMEKLL